MKPPGFAASGEVCTAGISIECPGFKIGSDKPDSKLQMEGLVGTEFLDVKDNGQTDP